MGSPRETNWKFKFNNLRDHVVNAKGLDMIDRVPEVEGKSIEKDIPCKH